MQKRFKSIDTNNKVNIYLIYLSSKIKCNKIFLKGFITVNDLRKHFHKRGEKISEEQLHEILEEVDCSNNAQIDLSEFLQVRTCLENRLIYR